MNSSDARKTHGPARSLGAAGKSDSIREVYDGMYREETRLSAKTPIEAIIDVGVANDRLKDK